MDVPTRQSYIMAVVRPEERSATAGITGVARTKRARRLLHCSPAVCTLDPSLINAPFLIEGTLKIIYDVLLYNYKEYVAVRPTEETC